MDSHKDATSMRNTLRFDDEGEKKTNCKATARQRGVNDNNVENVFTSVSNIPDSNLVSQNGPISRHFNSCVNESMPQTSKSSDKSLECNKNLTSSCQGNNRNNSYADLSEAASSSKTDYNTCDTEPQTCQRYKMFLDKSSYYSAPSTSGTSKDTDSCRASRKRPSTLKLNQSNIDADDSSSDTGNDDYSLGSEDGCIYTYRGGQHLADLPSSFFSLDMGLPLDKHLPTPPNYQVPQQAAPGRDQGSRASSPDMDFLEMDFDPGPSCEVDTGDESTPDVELEAASNMPEENEPVLRRGSPENLALANNNPPMNLAVASSSQTEAEACFYNVPSTSQGIKSEQGNVPDESSNQCKYGPFIAHVNVKGEQILVRRTMSHCLANAPVNLHVSGADLVTSIKHEEDSDGPFAYRLNQGESFWAKHFESTHNMSPATYHHNMVKRLMAESSESESIENDIAMLEDLPEAASCSTTDVRCIEPPRCMVWSEREACERQVTQIGISACGATAVVNVFIALGVPVNIEKINSAVGTRLRAHNAPLPRYLLSRAVAGCTAADLVNGIQKASDGMVTARFFPTHPERAMSLSHWLADWISLGAVPILTLNLQAGCEGDIPDAWHHQMVFGVSPRGVYLCNPVECVRESVLWPRLTSPSELLVKARDVMGRFTTNIDLTPLTVVPDRRFHTFNVLGQVVNVIREWRSAAWSERGTRTHHIRIPAAYQAGITVAALTGSEAHRRLMHVPQLPIINPQSETPSNKCS